MLSCLYNKKICLIIYLFLPENLRSDNSSESSHKNINITEK